jgi:hypothetical protein
MITMITSPYSDAGGDREILDTIRLHLFACYANVAHGREFTWEEIERRFATDEGLRA